MITKLFVFAFIASFAASYPAQALPIAQKGAAAHRFEIPFTLTENYNFEGIVALDDCSGSLVQLEKAKDTDQALVLTNGHCVETGFTPAGKFLYHQKSNRSFALMNATADTAGGLNATEIVYSTMTKTDLTIYKVGMTYAEIKAKYNVRPLVLSSQHPSATTPIEVISGYWQRGYKCSIEQFIPLLKEDQWTWEDSIRYSRPGCETIGGTSGSPIVIAGTRTMVGINNTGNESGAKCTLNNPCEVDTRGQITYERGRSYAQQTYQVYTCVNAAGEIDLSVPGCQLLH